MTDKAAIHEYMLTLFFLTGVAEYSTKLFQLHLQVTKIALKPFALLVVSLTRMKTSLNTSL